MFLLTVHRVLVIVCKKDIEKAENLCLFSRRVVSFETIKSFGNVDKWRGNRVSFLF